MATVDQDLIPLPVIGFIVQVPGFAACPSPADGQVELPTGQKLPPKEPSTHPGIGVVGGEDVDGFDGQTADLGLTAHPNLEAVTTAAKVIRIDFLLLICLAYSPLSSLFLTLYMLEQLPSCKFLFCGIGCGITKQRETLF